MTHDGRIKITWHPAPSGNLGPNGRTTPSHVFQIFNASGDKLVGGTFGADTIRAVAYARQCAAEKGIHNPRVDIFATVLAWLESECERYESAIKSMRAREEQNAQMNMLQAWRELSDDDKAIARARFAPVRDWR